MDFNFRYVAVAVLGAAAGLACGPAAASRAGRTDGGDAQRLAALVDYVGADYGGAVRGGVVQVATEYDEQLRFVGDARRLGRELVGDAAEDSDPLLQKLARLEESVQAKAAAPEVEQAAREAREEIVGRFRLPTVPTSRPSLENAENLYARSCAVCHGPTGGADTERARTLDPHPVGFRDPARLEKLSPYRVYNALTFGVAGTAMPSFDALSPAERWDLSFYVLRLGHLGEPARGPAPARLADLAATSDAELRERLRREGSADPDAALAYARVEAAFTPATAADIDRARRLVAQAAAAMRAGRARDADHLAIDAYLQGFEPLEASLQARDGRLVRGVEAGFRDMRAAIAQGHVQEALARSEDLDRLLASVAGDTSPTVPMSAAALIFFREGIEAALLIGALLAAVRKVGRPEAARYIHAGWLAALPAGVATWWLLERALTVGADRRELLEASLALLAAVVLFSVSFWMISRVESRRWLETLRRQVARGVGGRNLWLLAGLAFLALYREAAETILFTQALVVETGARSEVWTGAALGTLAVAAVAVLMNRAVVRLPLGPFFAVSGILLCGLAVSFAGGGMHTLVAAGYLPPRPVPFPEVPWMGIHPDLSGLLVQLLIVTIIAGGAVATVVRSHRPAREASR